ncbi:16S rRNA (cytosine967-C5)-methyltransferase [Roseinatronobacter thiooxidans]|uniref:16S rRNA (Cytosine967-C5)-methyltransferase n=1 Tax=Roseinatronobacter thiooxidans TaxID=121821 RepID=A0A2W7QUG3_9RHOB|nr:RsmB/NOP family class I SAM-dependent RNA methyltransferase [Roseinatronobacter thiooxidans]PZX47337.1 16S rRNA (cytosine967-C5)-methyltransferase [Roseinatronobacter thiooxidans]
MTPAARLQAAAEILDQTLNGMPAEQALTRWARNSRYAGSKDRAAVRDIVFDALRCKRSFAHLGGAETGRGLILGALRAQGQDPAAQFTGTGHAPAPLTPAEAAYTPPPMPQTVALDCPEWLAPQLDASLAAQFAPALQALRQRAPVFLRVNTARISRDQAIALLAQDGIEATLHPLAPTALEVKTNPRAIQQSKAYLDGLVELQDAASQAVIAALPPVQGKTVLDYCAGGGGKALALAALGALVTAHDANPARMQDIPPRAKRAQASITLSNRPEGQFDLVLTDVPCSGSGSWRRSPAGKWALTPEGLEKLHLIQAHILDKAKTHMRHDGYLAYVTCSMLASENHDQITAFLGRNPDLELVKDRQFTPQDGGDGFYLALINTRKT